MQLDEILKGHFLNLYHLALSDTEIETSELEILYKIGEEKGVDKREIDNILLAPNNVKFITPTTVIQKMECLYDLARIVWADGKVDSNERRVMELFCSKFGFQDENIQNIVQFLIDEVESGSSKEKVLNIVSENL